MVPTRTVLVERERDTYICKSILRTSETPEPVQYRPVLVQYRCTRTGLYSRQVGAIMTGDLLVLVLASIGTHVRDVWQY